MSKAKVKPVKLANSKVAELAKQFGTKLSKSVQDDLQDPWLSGDWRDGDKTVFEHYEGNTVVDGNFTVGPEGVIVSGDLDVKGCVKDGEEADVSLLIVMGNLRAQSICSLSQIFVFGDIEVDGVIYGNSMGDYALVAGGNVRAKAIVQDGHNFHFSGKVDSPYLTDWIMLKGDVVAGNCDHKDVLISDVFQDDNYIDLTIMCDHLKKGQEVLKKKIGPVPIVAKPRHFEFKEGTSNKFWEVSVSEQSVTTRWGKIGTEGQSKTKELDSDEAANKEYHALVKKKLAEGYVEKDGE